MSRITNPPKGGMWLQAVLASCALVGCSLTILGHSAFADIRPTTLRCESRENPLGIDVASPRLSWILTVDDRQRGVRQTAYRVLTASSNHLLSKDQGDLWDSGIVQSDQNILIQYGGKSLGSCQQVFWKVRFWDQNHSASPWSEVAEWTTGILKPENWIAKWVGGQVGAPSDGQPPVSQMIMLRRTFSVKAGVRRALVNICGLGQYELSLNGEKVGDDALTPGWTNYRKTCLYNTYDVTAKLIDGENAIGIMLGNGMYNVPRTPGRYTKFTGSMGKPKAIAQLDISYADGITETIATDGTWRISNSPITFSGVYGGEDYDARLEQPGWNRRAFDDFAWQSAEETDGPGGTLCGISRSAPAIRTAQELNPISVNCPSSGIYVYDLGQNCAIIPRLTVRGARGSAVRLTPGEILNRDGMVDQGVSGGPAFMTYTLKGDGDEVWSPRFFYYGARYIQVQGAVPLDADNPDNLPVVVALKGQFITSTSPSAGEFSCSNELFNRTANLIRWAMRSNMQNVLTDCPHREKLGWLEQDHLVGSSLMYNFNVAALMAKTCADIADAQTAKGLVPDIAPEYTAFKGGFRDSPEWGSACILIPWQLYQWYGDRAVLADRYDTTRRYIDYLTSRANDHIVSYGLGDWFDIGPRKLGEAQLTSKSLTATAFYFRDAAILGRIAQVLGNEEDAAKYDELANSIKEAFIRKLYDKTTQNFDTGSQTANALPLVFGLIPPEDRPAVVTNLVADIHKHNNGLTAGDIGYRYLLRALADAGRSDVIFDMNNRSDRPGYGYMLAKGATSLTEGWDGSASQDHFMLGHIMEWFYGDLAGIQCDPSAVAFKKIRIKPTPVGDVNWAKADYQCSYGLIESSWKLDGDKFVLDVVIPSNTSATIYIPSRQKESVRESGKELAAAEDVKVLTWDNGYTAVEVEAGHYRFESQMPKASP